MIRVPQSSAMICEIRAGMDPRLKHQSTQITKKNNGWGYFFVNRQTPSHISPGPTGGFTLQTWHRSM